MMLEWTQILSLIFMLKKVVNEWRIPFKIDYEIPNEETRKAIKEVEELKKNSNMKTYDSFDEMLKDLNKDDD